jgi:AAA domain/Sugar-specific transcriptional regulator TrmB
MTLARSAVRDGALGLVPEIEAEPVGRFRLVTGAALASMPPAEWVIDGLLTEQALGVLYGSPGTGKSFLALAWAMAIARGVPWIDRETRRGPVVYLAAEGGYGIAQRYRAYCDAHEVAGHVDAYFILEPANLLEAVDVGDLLRAVDVQLTTLCLEDPSEKRVLPSLVVIDTMHRCMVGGDENSARDVGLVIAAADRIRRDAQTAVLIVHHTQKVGELERGSSALRGAADAMFLLRQEDEHLLLEVTKQKDAPSAPAVRLALAVQAGSCTIEPLDARSQAAGLGGNDRKVLQAVSDTSLDGETGVRQVLETCPLPRASVYRSLKRLIQLGYVGKTKAKYRVMVAGEPLVSDCLR